MAFIGVGSDLRTDDGAGVEFVARLGALKNIASRASVLCLNGGSAPENITGEIVRFQPDHVVFVDAADFGGQVGEVRLIDPRKISGITFSSHMMPLPIVMSYLMTSLRCEFAIVGMQPQCLEFGEGLTEEIDNAVNVLVMEVGSWM